MPGNTGNINSHPFNLPTFFPLPTLSSVYTRPSPGPQQPQLGGIAEFLVRSRVAHHHKSEKASGQRCSISPFWTTAILHVAERFDVHF